MVLLVASVALLLVGAAFEVAARNYVARGAVLAALAVDAASLIFLVRDTRNGRRAPYKGGEDPKR